MNYTNREVVKRLKQYDMFLSSLGLAKDENTKERICDQLDKIEKQIMKMRKNIDKYLGKKQLHLRKKKLDLED